MSSEMQRGKKMIMEKIEDNTKKYGERYAILTRNDTITYDTMLKNINQIVNRLGSFRLEDNEPLGIMCSNSIEFVLLLFLCLVIERPAVLFSVAFKKRELSYHLEGTGVRKIFCDAKGLGKMHDIGFNDRIEIFNNIYLYEFNNKDKLQYKDMYYEDDFICQFTSGTNGIPKAAVRSEPAVWNEITETSEMIHYSENEIVLTIPPIYHSYGLIAGTLLPLSYGGTVFLLDGFIPSEVFDTIKNFKINYLFAVPYMYHLLNQSFSQHKADFSAIKHCFSAGAPLHERVLNEFYSNFGKHISQDYGSTETGVMCLNLNTEEYPESVGLPVGSKIMKAYDENGNLLDDGETGELRIKSIASAKRYLYPKELNETTFRDGWYSTGDIGKLDNKGYVYITGRKSSVINVAGLKVDPNEVERVILELPEVKEVVVVGRDTNSAGQIVKAVIVAKKKIDELKVIQYCKSQLADYKVPKEILFLDELPRSATGKVLRKYLVR